MLQAIDVFIAAATCPRDYPSGRVHIEGSDPALRATTRAIMRYRNGIVIYLDHRVPGHVGVTTTTDQIFKIFFRDCRPIV